MASYSLKEIADAHGYSETQTRRHIQDLIQKGSFAKSSEYKFFNEDDANKLAQLLKFTLPQKNGNGKA